MIWFCQAFKKNLKSNRPVWWKWILKTLVLALGTLYWIILHFFLSLVFSVLWFLLSDWRRWWTKVILPTRVFIEITTLFRNKIWNFPYYYMKTNVVFCLFFILFEFSIFDKLSTMILRKEPIIFLIQSLNM